MRFRLVKDSYNGKWSYSSNRAFSKSTRPAPNWAQAFIILDICAIFEIQASPILAASNPSSTKVNHEFYDVYDKFGCT